MRRLNWLVFVGNHEQFVKSYGCCFLKANCRACEVITSKLELHVSIGLLNARAARTSIPD